MAKDAFYNAILNAGADMQKTASEHDILAALEETDLSEEELNKLASELEEALDDLDDEDADDVEVETEDIEDADAGKQAAEEDDADAEVGADEDVEDETGTDVEDETGTDEEADTNEEIEDDGDLESLAAAYDAEYEKYASEGRTVRDYVYDQVDDAEFAAVVGDMAEKLAFISDLPVFMVADDLMTTISEKISAGEHQDA